MKWILTFKFPDWVYGLLTFSDAKHTSLKAEHFISPFRTTAEVSSGEVNFTFLRSVNEISETITNTPLNIVTFNTMAGFIQVKAPYNSDLSVTL